MQRYEKIHNPANFFVKISIFLLLSPGLKPVAAEERGDFRVAAAEALIE